MTRHRRAGVILAAIVAASASTGCLAFDAATLPDQLVAAAGWERDAAASDAEPASSQLGLAKTQRGVYKDEADDGRGHPGRVLLITSRTLIAPSEDALLDLVQEQIRSSVEAQGVRLDAEAGRGQRDLANGASSRYFTYDGTIVDEGEFFTARNARIKIMGEVSQCRDERTNVVGIALAQVSDTRTIQGVTYATDHDATTWREIASDPTGTIEGMRGSNGLLYNVRCS